MPLLNILKQSTLKNKKFLKRKNKFYKKIGRQTLFLGLALSSLIFLILIPVSIGLYFLINGETNGVWTFYQNIFNDFKSNYYFVFIQIFVILFAIWIAGPKLSQQIIENKRNYYWTSVFIIILLWILVCISSASTAAIQNSFKYGVKGFKNVITNWFLFGFLPFLFLGTLHALIIVFFIGKRIQTKGVKFNTLEKYKRK